MSMESKASTSIRTSILRPGRVKKYLRSTFGKVAFEKKGTIKPEYLNKAIAKVKGEPGKLSLERALVDAKNLKKLAAERARG